MLFTRSNSLESSAHSVDDNMSVNSQDSQQGPSTPGSRISSGRRGRVSTSKFDAMIKDEQRHLTEEIRTCKNYVRNLQQKRKVAQRGTLGITQIWAKEHASDLMEEISTCEQELKFEDSVHSIDISISRRRPSIFKSNMEESEYERRICRAA